MLQYKKLRVELKKKATEAIRLQKKLIKKNQQYQQLQQQTSSTHITSIHNSLNELKYKYDNSFNEVKHYYTLLEETEKQHLRLAMIEERNHFCTFFKFLKPIIVSPSLCFFVINLNHSSDSIQNNLSNFILKSEKFVKITILFMKVRIHD